ncbi:hypothetical protein BGZ65_005517 [Modicella reniformis]|uniref:Uncharacterized protein n=1 Tax=Modicella reniformis TaxID=1440133 RepID=A0A9P6STD2_9FUNG|nr:hypothetical protein BGZ65_005517 [Modicella reniformis]
MGSGRLEALPLSWHYPQQGQPIQAIDDELDSRLELAGMQLAKTSFNENMKTAQRRLLDFGLVPLANDSPMPSTARLAVVRRIIQDLYPSSDHRSTLTKG